MTVLFPLVQPLPGSCTYELVTIAVFYSCQGAITYVDMRRYCRVHPEVTSLCVCGRAMSEVIHTVDAVSVNLSLLFSWIGRVLLMLHCVDKIFIASRSIKLLKEFP